MKRLSDTPAAGVIFPYVKLMRRVSQYCLWVTVGLQLTNATDGSNASLAAAAEGEASTDGCDGGGDPGASVGPARSDAAGPAQPIWPCLSRID